MAWTDSPDIIDMQQDPQGVYSPFSRKRSIPDPYGLDNSPSQDAITLNSPAHDAYRPTLAHAGAASPSTPIAPSANPYAARLTDLGNQLQSAYAAPHAGTARQILGALFARKNPQLGGLISGETQRERKIEPLQNEYALTADIANRQYAQQKTLADIYKSTAEGGKFAAEAGAVPTKMALEAAQAEAANYKDDPNLGLIDLRTKQPVNPAGMAPLTKDEADVLGKQEGDKVPLKLKNTANEIVNRGYTTVNTEEGVYEHKRGAPVADMTRLGANPRMVFSPENRIVPGAADPYNPGNLTYMRAGEAMRTGALAPGAAAVGAAKTEAKSEVPTKIGDQKVAFTTMIQHADLLRTAAKALNNGDNQTLAGLKNKFKNEFGYSGPITAAAIADAYKGEVSNVINKGHITDTGNEKIAHTLDPTSQNYQTIDSVLSAYQALAQSKMDMLTKQANASKGGGANEIHYHVENGQLVPNTKPQ